MNMNDTVRIVCENTGRSLFVNRGTSLLQIAEILSLGEREDRPFLAAYVNNRLKELDFAVYSPVSIRYVDITHFEGMRVYQRTLFFVLQKAVYDLFPERKLHIKHSVAKGFYCEIEGMEDLSDEQIVRIKERMRAIVAQDLPIVRQKVTSAEAEAMYGALGLDDKIALLRTRPHLYVTVYSMADLVGYFYGALAVSTGYVSRFDLHPYYKGFRMALPQRTDPTKLEELVPQDKMFEVFSEYTCWVDVIGVANIALHTREKTIDVLESDYVRFARTRGLSTWGALRHHGLRNLALPALTLQFASISEIFGGSVLVEQVFSYPGLGQAAVTAGLGGDVALLAGIALFSAAFVFGGNLIANVLYGVVDPRMRKGAKAHA